MWELEPCQGSFQSSASPSKTLGKHSQAPPSTFLTPTTTDTEPKNTKKCAYANRDGFEGKTRAAALPSNGASRSAGRPRFAILMYMLPGKIQQRLEPMKAPSSPVTVDTSLMQQATVEMIQTIELVIATCAIEGLDFMAFCKEACELMRESRAAVKTKG